MTWTAAGLTIDSGTALVSAEPGQKIANRGGSTGAVTIEVWITPQNVTQAGPARIVSQSTGHMNRNVTLAVDADLYHTRMRTDLTDEKGLPHLDADPGTASTELTHVVMTRDLAGTRRLYVDGEMRGSDEHPGGFATWDGSLPLRLVNEDTGDRPWLGQLFRVAIYDRALSESEVDERFAAGSGGL